MNQTTTTQASPTSDLSAYLAQRDLPCPACGRNLRGVTGDKCPECGLELSVPILEASPSRTPGAILIVRWLALAAMAVAAYLAYTGLTKSAPAGCGQGGGCDQVLGSKWSTFIWPWLPISVPAVFVYLGIFASTFYLRPTRPEARRREAWQILLVLAVFAAAAAVWFVALQLFVIRSICPWCMAEHALGLIIAVIVLTTAPIGRGEKLPDGSRSSMKLTPGRGAALIAASAAVMVLFINTQAQFGQAPARDLSGVVRGQGPGTDPSELDPTLLPPDQDKSNMVWVKLYNGPRSDDPLEDRRVYLSRDSAPVIGSPDAPYVILAHVDFTCPHCQHMHNLWLPAAFERWGDQVAFMILPTPYNSRCNPLVTPDDDVPILRDGCDLAKLALSLFKADPAKFKEYDQWLFAQTREVPDARAMAEALIGADALKAALDTGFADQQIKRNTQIFGMATVPGQRSIPILLCHDFFYQGRGDLNRFLTDFERDVMKAQ